jgi:hypothetical protein
MSYLRGLASKTRAPRPRIAPLVTSPASQPSFNFDEMKQEEALIASPPSSTVAAVQPALLLPTVPRAAGSAPTDLGLPFARTGQRDPVSARRRERAPYDVASESASAPVGVGVPRPPPGAPAAAGEIVSPSAQTASRPAAGLPRQDRRAERASKAAPKADLHADPIVPRSPQQRIAIEPPPWRNARAANAAEPPPQGRDQLRPDVHISIGRLEVRATVTAPAKSERPAPFRPMLTLEDYLASRSRGR